MTEWCTTFYRLQIFRLVYNFHSLGISHGDLEPRNAVRTDDGKFLLIDFTESREHRSKKCVAQHVHQLAVHTVIVLTYIGVDPARGRLYSTQKLQVL